MAGDESVGVRCDPGYDDTQLIAACWHIYQIKPVIDSRNMRQDPDTTRLLTGHPTVTYNERGEVFCHDPVTGQVHTVSNGGFEAGRQRLKNGALLAWLAYPLLVKPPGLPLRAFASPSRPSGEYRSPESAMGVGIRPPHGGRMGEQSVGLVVRV